MELAGTAVGIISLGLQVCQGIVSYSQAWRGYDEEIQNARNKAQALRMPLKTLRDTVEELQQTRPEVAADLEEQAMSMQSSIEKLKKVVDRFKPAQSEAFPDKVRAQLKKGVYYFQKDTLQDVQNHLDQIQNVLQTSLLMWVYNLTKYVPFEDVVVDPWADITGRIQGSPEPCKFQFTKRCRVCIPSSRWLYHLQGCHRQVYFNLRVILNTNNHRWCLRTVPHWH